LKAEGDARQGQALKAKEDARRTPGRQGRGCLTDVGRQEQALKA
jgi:hypothetical protein